MQHDRGGSRCFTKEHTPSPLSSANRWDGLDARWICARTLTDWPGLSGEAAYGIWKKTSFFTRLPKAALCLDTKNPLPGRKWVRKLRLS
jgi:hypothetical protein